MNKNITDNKYFSEFKKTFLVAKKAVKENIEQVDWQEYFNIAKQEVVGLINKKECKTLTYHEHFFATGNSVLPLAFLFVFLRLLALSINWQISLIVGVFMVSFLVIIINYSLLNIYKLTPAKALVCSPTILVIMGLVISSIAVR